MVNNHKKICKYSHTNINCVCECVCMRHISHRDYVYIYTHRCKSFTSFWMFQFNFQRFSGNYCKIKNWRLSRMHNLKSKACDWVHLYPNSALCDTILLLSSKWKLLTPIQRYGEITKTDVITCKLWLTHLKTDVISKTVWESNVLWRQFLPLWNQQAPTNQPTNKNRAEKMAIY